MMKNLYYSSVALRNILSYQVHSSRVYAPHQMKVSLEHTQQDRSDVQQELALKDKIDINDNALFSQK